MYLGRISYGTYLWHWLVVVVIVREADLSHLATAATAAAVGTGLASLSYELLELPIRSADVLDRLRPVVIASGLALSLLVGLRVVPAIMDDGTGQAAAIEVGDSGSVRPAGAAVPAAATLQAAFLDTYDYAGCEVSGPVACPLHHGTGQRAIVVGESHAGMLTPMLVDLAERHDLDLYGGFLSYCPWTRGIRYTVAGKDCFADQSDLYDRIIPELDPDIVFLAHRPVDDVNSFMDMTDRDEGPLGHGARRDAVLGRRIESVVADLRAQHRTVVMFEPIPVQDQDHNPLSCLSGAETVDACRFVTRDGPGPEERVERRLAADDDRVESVDLDRAVCPYLPICDPVVDGLVVKHDDNHLTLRFSASLLDPVDEYLTLSDVLH